MAIADHVSPREAVRADLRERLRELVDASVQRIDVDAPLDPDAPGELDATGEPAKLWQNVPVVTVRDLEAAIRTVFDGRLPAPSEKTAEVATPALVFVAAECPRCHIAGRIPLTVSVELHQDSDGETLHLKPKSKEALHTCGQLPLPEGEDQEQASFDLDDITGPVPTSLEVMAAIENLGDTLAELIEPRFLPSLGLIDEWSDLEKREVALWAHTKRQELDGVDALEIPPLPVVLGGEPHDPQPTQEDMDAEADLGSEDEQDAGDDPLLPV